MKSRSRKDDAATRILRAKGNPAELDRILQDECRRRASRKLAATLSSAPGFRFPTSLSAEQCTADNVAEFHASLIEPGSSVVDLTCGLGIDSFHMARRCSRVVCIDIDSDVSAAIGHNAGELGLEKNISAVCGDCREWLEEYAGEPFDVAFIDPARRADDGSRLYSLAQCKPDVVELLPLIAAHARRLVIKASPMLDVTKSLAELSDVAAVYAVGTKAECKELLFDIRFGHSGTAVNVNAVTVGDGAAVITPVIRDKAVQYVSEIKPGDIIGEPWPSVMKLQPGGISPCQLHPSTYLFCNPPSDFPGNLYVVERVEPFSSSNLRRLAKEKIEASVAVRNFPLQADALRQRIKNRESSTTRLMATTLYPNLQILAFLSPIVVKNA